VIDFITGFKEYTDLPPTSRASAQLNCNYSYDGLRANLPAALASVDISTIRKWEHRMIRWMDAYRGGKDAKEAQIVVKQFSSRRYTSHRRIPEGVAASLD